jgi:preprotein translocase subunit SecA
MFSFLKSIFAPNDVHLDSLNKVLRQVNSRSDWASSLDDDGIRGEIERLRKSLTDGQTLDDILPEVFALTREVSDRVNGQRPFDVQIIASIAFHKGSIAEQKTGEGKTLSAVPAMVLNALTGEGVHLVTVNDYLARRDAGWMAPIYHALGLSTGVIYSGQGDQPASIYDPEYTDSAHTDPRLMHLRPCSRREAYEADITYGTNNEFGFDYLRDNMSKTLARIVQRGHNFAIVDEVDSILIDEARTPLIISAPDTEPTDKYLRFSQIISSLSGDTDYEVDEKMRTANLSDHGLRKIEKILGVENLYQQDYDTLHHLEQALKARTLFQIDKDYVIKDGEVVIVDDHTGRLMFGRRYSDGLHQAIEAKEGVKIQQESRTFATISLQNYFRLYKKLSGMTGTAVTEATEFRKIYNLEVIVIPTNRQVQRIDHADMVYKTQSAKYTAIVNEVHELHATGQPILIGTKSIDQNEVISQYLKKKKIPHQVLNAKNHEQEALIISEAGRKGAVTVATNIAGRGVDIVLGGDKTGRKEEEWQIEAQEVKNIGGLHILGAVRHESRRIDNQLRGRSGRQGDPGSSRFYISLEDDIMRIFGGDQVSRLMGFLKVPEDQPLEAGMVSKAIETAQTKVESFYFDQRKHLVEYDDVMNKQRVIYYKRRYQILSGSSEITGNYINNALEREIGYLANIYAGNKIDKEEAKTLTQEIQTIIPLDPQSLKSLKSALTGRTGDEASTILTDIVSQARVQQKDRFAEHLPDIERQVILDSFDELWMRHLDAIDNLRDGIGLRGYGQKDPLVEYKHEAFNMFETLLMRIESTVARRIFRVQIQGLDMSRLPQAQPASTDPALAGKKADSAKLGRNDPCWCGSGKKWKSCHYPALG